MATTKKTLSWNSVNVATLPANLKVLWAARAKAAEALKEATAKFEGPFKQVLIAKGLGVEAGDDVIRVGYNFGGLSYAQDKKGSSNKGGVDLG